MLMITTKKNLVSTERTGGVRLEPGVYARSMEAVLAFQQPPQPLAVHSFMKANHAIWGCLVIPVLIAILSGIVLPAKGERRDVVFPPEKPRAQSYGEEDDHDDNGAPAICCGRDTASHPAHHHLHLVFHDHPVRNISKLEK
ncbi:hypothetical protein OIU74_007202 [Salix koriyanagi]|uniref:Uncharacterized protein n=1 Tax=Salix koriyanagi TaxID=2511006 RepID=A0A9Q0Z603_9ROSI|nr:hypothetical protein OIU74_007202 [Salix koriyanagi]